MDLPTDIVALLAYFAPVFAARTWPEAQLLALGALLAIGRRTVASALHVMGRADRTNSTNYHRLLDRDAWSGPQAARILLGLIPAVLPGDAPLVLAVDDTVERRNGPRIKAKGFYRDAVRSSKKHPVKCFGLKWVTLAVLLPMSWGNRVRALPVLSDLSGSMADPAGAPRGNRVRALPVLSALCPPAAKGPRPRGQRTHKATIDWARQLALQVRRWAPGRRVALVVDGGFASVALAAACRRHEIALVCRLESDAAFYDNPIDPAAGPSWPQADEGGPAVEPGAAGVVPGCGLGRGRGGLVRGTSPGDESPHRFGIVGRSGCPAVAVELSGGPRSGGDAPGRGVLLHRRQAVAAVVLGYVVQRRGPEVTSAEVRAHPGMETQRQWSDLAILRTTPVLLGLYSLVCPSAVRWHGEGSLKPAGSAWYSKGEPTFSDCVALVRRRIWENQEQPGSSGAGDVLELPAPLWEGMIDCLSRAA